jgi:hypothetical protein
MLEYLTFSYGLAGGGGYDDDNGFGAGKASGQGNGNGIGYGFLCQDSEEGQSFSPTLLDLLGGHGDGAGFGYAMGIASDCSRQIGEFYMGAGCSCCQSKRDVKTETAEVAQANWSKPADSEGSDPNAGACSESAEVVTEDQKPEVVPPPEGTPIDPTS